jgi:hypothetical protein
MTNALPLSSRIYDRLLALYPPDLRRDFGADMALVFADDLATARREAGTRGVIRVWRCALYEFLRYALPASASSSGVRVPIISVAFAFASLGTELFLHYTTNQPARFQITGLLASFAPMLIPLGVVWGCRGSAVISLDLSYNLDEEH